MTIRSSSTSGRSSTSAGLRPFNPAHLIPLGDAGRAGRRPQLQHAHDRDPGARRRTCSRRAACRTGSSGSTPARADRRSGSSAATAPSTRDGPQVQVSRLGNPLINEVIIPVGKKDLWNASDPRTDAQFLEHYRTPELAGLVNALYGPPRGGHAQPRTGTISSPCSSPAYLPGAQPELHREHEGRPPPPEHGDSAVGEPESARRCSRRRRISRASRTAAG